MSLSHRQLEIVSHIAQGMTYKRTARAMGIGIGTVQTHMAEIRVKLGVSSKAQAVYVCAKKGLI